MLVFFEILFKICFFKANPQDLPMGRHWVYITAALIIIATILAGASKDASGSIAAFAFLQVALYAGIIWLILKLKGFQARWDQTIMALFGTSFLLQVAAIPFAGRVNIMETGQIVLTGELIAVAIISVWNLAIVAYILKNALESTFFSALAFGFFAQLISLFVALNIVGPSFVDPAL